MKPATLDQLFTILKTNPTAEQATQHGLATNHGECDWTDLPTFGGERPNDTAAIWSWDANRIITGTCASDIKIVSRDYAGQ